MASPFADYANSEIKFGVPSVHTGEVDRYGNPKIQTVELIVIAMLKEKKGMNQPAGLAGADLTGILLEGFLIEPEQLPATLEVGSVGAIALNRGNNVLKGRFTLLPTIPNPILVAEDIKELSKIKGLFQYP